MRRFTAVVTVEREALVRRLRESNELGHLQSRFERLRSVAGLHDADVAEWEALLGHPLGVPRIEFTWPPKQAWNPLLGSEPHPPALLWPEDQQVLAGTETNTRKPGQPVRA